LISDVIDAKITNGNRFRIQFRTGDGKKRKNIEYEAIDTKTAIKIVSKLQYIK